MLNSPTSTPASTANTPRLKRRGFTIVELLIVIVVIGILAAISIVAYNGIQARAAMTKKETVINNAHKQFELHRVEFDSYPNTYDDWSGVVDTAALEHTNIDTSNFKVDPFSHSIDWYDTTEYTYEKSTVYISSYYTQYSSGSSWTLSFLYWDDRESEWVMKREFISYNNASDTYSTSSIIDIRMTTDSNDQPFYDMPS